MLTASLALQMLAGTMLALSFLILGRMRLFSMLKLFVWQSVLLAAYALVVAVSMRETELLVTVVLTLALKAFYIPRLLSRTAKFSHVLQRLQAYLRPATQLFLGALTIVLAFFLTRSLVPMEAKNYLVAAVSVSMVLLGLLMLVVRRDMYGQIIGFLMMENGIFTFGMALTGGMPLMVELGVFFDVMIGSVLMANLSYKVQTELGTVVTDRLNELVD